MIDVSKQWGESRTLNLNSEQKLNYLLNGYCIDPGKRRLVLSTPFSFKNTISYGLVVFAKNTGRWIMVENKNTIDFLIFFEGSYRLTNLPLILSLITQDESDIIRQCLIGGPDKFASIYMELQLNPDGLPYALMRMMENYDTISSLLSNLELFKNKLKWTWPKGRISYSNRETPFECAKREFVEEVEIALPDPLFISDNYIHETIKTMMGRSIESRYWIYITENEVPIHRPELNLEVNDRKWVDIETCRNMMNSSSLFNQAIEIVSRALIAF